MIKVTIQEVHKLSLYAHHGWPPMQITILNSEKCFRNKKTYSAKLCNNKYHDTTQWKLSAFCSVS